MGDPLGLTLEQRAASDMTVTYGELVAEMLMACPLCRAYECLSSCLSRISDAGLHRAWTEAGRAYRFRVATDALRTPGQ